MNNFMDYLIGVGEKVAPSVIRRRIANRTAAHKADDESEDENREPVDDDTLKEVASQFDIDVEESDEQEKKDDESSELIFSESDNEGPAESQESTAPPKVPEGFLTDIVSQEVGRQRVGKVSVGKRTRREFESSSDDQEEEEKKDDDSSELVISESSEDEVPESQESSRSLKVPEGFLTDIVSQEVGRKRSSKRSRREFESSSDENEPAAPPKKRRKTRK